MIYKIRRYLWVCWHITWAWLRTRGHLSYTLWIVFSDGSKWRLPKLPQLPKRKPPAGP